MPCIILCLFGAFAASAHPSVSGGAIWVNGYTFNLPHESRPELNVNRSRLEPILVEAMESKMNDGDLRRMFQSFVGFSIYSGTDFNVEVAQTDRYDANLYRIIWNIPPDATLEEVRRFIVERLKFLPAKDFALAPPKRPMRPIGHRPTAWNQCFDRLRFSAPPPLL